MTRTKTNNEENIDKYITTGEAAEMTGYSSGNIRFMIRKGYVPAIKVGPRAWMVLKKAVLNYEPRPVGRPKEGKN